MYADKINIEQTKALSENILIECYTLCMIIKNEITLKSSWNFSTITSMISYINSDQKLIDLICRRDSIINQINKVYNALDILPDERESQVLRLIYLEKQSYYDISIKTGIIERKISHIKNKALINFAIVMNIEVRK